MIPMQCTIDLRLSEIDSISDPLIKYTITETLTRLDLSITTMHQYISQYNCTNTKRKIIKPDENINMGFTSKNNIDLFNTCEMRELPICLLQYLLEITILFYMDQFVLFPGDFDHIPEVAFYMVGGIEEVQQKAERLAEEQK